MKTIKILSLLFPIVVLLGFVGLHTVNQKTGTLWVIDIEGYDPRDLLRGHFLRFRYSWNWDDGQNACYGNECYLCLNQVEPNVFKNPNTRLFNRPEKESMPTCTSMINGYGYGSQHGFHIGHKSGNGLEQYYIPEKYANMLNRMIWRREESEHKFAVGLRVNEAGVAFIETLYIDSKPLNQWLDEYEADQGE